MSNNSWTIISISITVIVSIIFVLQNIQVQKFQKKIAEAQSAFAKSEIKIEFFQTYFKNIIFVGDFSSNAFIEIPLEIQIANSGDKKIENLESYVTYPDAIHEWHEENIKYSTKGVSMYQMQLKLVDKSEHKHMLCYDFGNIPPKSAARLVEHVYISDLLKTTSTVIFGITKAKTKDNININIKDVNFIAWMIQFFLRHNDGSHSEDFHLHFWNTSMKTMDEYLKYFLTNEEIDYKKILRDHENFTKNYLRKFNWFKRVFRWQYLRTIWDAMPQESYLIVQLEFKKIDFDSKMIKKLAPEWENYSSYHSSIKKQNVLLVLNNGDKILDDRESFEKKYRVSSFRYNKQMIS